MNIYYICTESFIFGMKWTGHDDGFGRVACPGGCAFLFIGHFFDLLFPDGWKMECLPGLKDFLMNIQF